VAVSHDSTQGVNFFALACRTRGLGCLSSSDHGARNACSGFCRAYRARGVGPIARMAARHRLGLDLGEKPIVVISRALRVGRIIAIGSRPTATANAAA
jgi:hypothetical protein